MQGIVNRIVSYAQFYAECHMQTLFTECHYPECHYAECHGSVNVIKLFSSSLTLQQNKLECLCMTSFQACLIFVNEACANLGEAPYSAPIYG